MEAFLRVLVVSLSLFAITIRLGYNKRVFPFLCRHKEFGFLAYVLTLSFSPLKLKKNEGNPLNSFDCRFVCSHDIFIVRKKKKEFRN